jgi:hypothetical protein
MRCPSQGVSPFTGIPLWCSYIHDAAASGMWLAWYSAPSGLGTPPLKGDDAGETVRGVCEAEGASTSAIWEGAGEAREGGAPAEWRSPRWGAELVPARSGLTKCRCLRPVPPLPDLVSAPSEEDAG